MRRQALRERVRRQSRRERVRRQARRARVRRERGACGCAGKRSASVWASARSENVYADECGASVFAGERAALHLDARRRAAAEACAKATLALGRPRTLVVASPCADLAPQERQLGGLLRPAWWVEAYSSRGAARGVIDLWNVNRTRLVSSLVRTLEWSPAR